MELEKQKLILSCLANSRDLMALCSGIIRPSYFDPSLKKTVRFMQGYFEKYKDIPKPATIRAEGGILLDTVGEVTRAEVKYISEELETFCRIQAVTEAVLAGPEFIEKQEFGKLIEALKQATSIGLQKDMGLDYFADPENRLRSMLDVQRKISTGIPELDSAIGGGVGRQELLLVLANSGGGKSMTMLNIAKNMLMQGLNGIYISLEMAESIVASRSDSMITNISQENILKEISKVANLIENAGDKMGKFIIKRMPENRTNVDTVRSYLQQLEQTSGFIPDFIVVDYIDIMGTTMNITMDNLFIKDKYVTEEVRSLGYDFNAVIISAAQLGRAAIEADKLNHSHIQGGLSKIQTSDYTVAIKQDEVMRAAGEIYFEILKSRNSSGVGKRIHLGWDPVSLCIKSLQKNNDFLQLKKKKEHIILNDSGTVLKRDEGGGILGLMTT